MRLAWEGSLEALDPSGLSRLLDRGGARDAGLEREVARIVEEVRREGDDALRRMAREWDGVVLDALEVPPIRWRQAEESLDPAVRAALRRAAGNLARFHEAQRPVDLELEIEAGVRVGRRTVPLRAVGVYAPGGRAAYPSSVLMGVVPARAAGVPSVVVCAPPGAGGDPPAAVQAACLIAGATRLFAIGGAGAVTALAYGTASVPRCDAVVGPGNRWVTEAKRQVAGEVRVDAPAGPSEVLVVAGPSADAEIVAAELVAQAEHDPDAAAVAVAWDRELLTRIRHALARRVAAAGRRTTVEAALAARGALLLATDRDAALAFADAYGAEHLALHTGDPRADLEGRTTSGSVFLGQSSSVAFGDYLTGANHVLPTGLRGRAFSGLSTLDFVRFSTWQETTEEGAAALASHTALLAESEGLPAHAEAARLRAGPAGMGSGRAGGRAEP